MKKAKRRKIKNISKNKEFVEKDKDADINMKTEEEIKDRQNQKIKDSKKDTNKRDNRIMKKYIILDIDTTKRLYEIQDRIDENENFDKHYFFKKQAQLVI